jgi:hypothetical protein
MKKNIIEIASEKKITRKQAIQKAGITALTATSLLFLQTKAHAQASTGDTQERASSLGGGRNER